MTRKTRRRNRRRRSFRTNVALCFMAFACCIVLTMTAAAKYSGFPFVVHSTLP